MLIEKKSTAFSDHSWDLGSNSLKAKHVNRGVTTELLETLKRKDFKFEVACIGLVHVVITEQLPNCFYN